MPRDENVGVQRLQRLQSLPHTRDRRIFVVIVVTLEHQISAHRHPLFRQKQERIAGGVPPSWMPQFHLEVLEVYHQRLVIRDLR